MDFPTSSNCNGGYEKPASLFCSGTVRLPGSNVCQSNVTLVSCQNGHFENPDETTRKDMLAKGRAELERNPLCRDMMMNGTEQPSLENVRTLLIGAQSVDYSGEKLSHLGLTSNCFAVGNDLTDATHRASAKCTNQYEFVKDGRRVKNTNMTFLSNLMTCDVTDSSMQQIEEDLKKVAMHNAKENGIVVSRPEDFACEISILPVL